MRWSDAYIGLPYRDQGRDSHGVDCWGLARMVYARELGIELPSYAGAYASASERSEIDGLITGARRVSWTRVAAPGAFDLLLFRIAGQRSHIGIHVGAGRMLHVFNREQAKLEHFDRGRWAQRFCGAFRHVSRMGESA